MTAPVRERRWYAFPVLVAAYPAFFVSGLYPGRLTAHEVAIAVAVPVSAAALIYLLTAAVLRRRVPPSVVAFVAAGIAGWLACAQMVADRLPQLRQRLGLALCAAIVAAGVTLLLRRGRPVPRGARTAELFLVALLAIAAYGALSVQWAAERETRRERATLGWDTLPAAAPAASPRANRPDIYLIVLDNFSNANVMSEAYGHSLAPFVDSLRALGFVVPATRSNYAWTALSLSSMLNMTHLAPVALPPGSRAKRADPLYRLVEDNRAVGFLKREGYTIYAAPSTHFAGTYGRGGADEVVRPAGVGALRFVIAKSSILESVLDATVPGRLLAVRFGRTLADPRIDVEQFSAVADLASRPGPKFVMLHSMLAHNPFYVDGECRPARGSSYTDAAQCVQRLVLMLAGRVLRESTRPAVILVQADHGGAPEGFTHATSLDDMSPAMLAQRFGAFGAYYLPAGGADDLGPVVTPVNVMRGVFSRYLGADLPPLPNGAYFAPYERPFELRAVDTLALEAGMPPHDHRE